MYGVELTHHPRYCEFPNKNEARDHQSSSPSSASDSSGTKGKSVSPPSRRRIDCTMSLQIDSSRAMARSDFEVAERRTMD